MSLSREQMLVEMGISPLWVQREPGSQLNVAGGKPAPVESAVAEKPTVLASQPPVATPREAPVRPMPRAAPEKQLLPALSAGPDRIPDLDDAVKAGGQTRGLEIDGDEGHIGEWEPPRHAVDATRWGRGGRGFWRRWLHAPRLR